MATAKKRHVESHSKGTLKSLLDDFNTATKAPEKFISPQVKVASHFTNLTKQIFDFSQENRTDANANLSTLPELIIDNFDDEQIWQEIELQNAQCLKHSFQDVAKVIAKKDKDSFFKKKKSDANKVSPEEDEAEDEQDNLEYSGSQDLFPEMQSEEDDGDAEHESDDSDSETNFDIDEFERRKIVSKKKKQDVRNSSFKGGKSNVRTSVVDDKFFKLSEMERFLELEDAREERRRLEEEGQGGRDRGEGGDDNEDEDDDNESIDYFQELPSEDEELDEDEDNDESQEFKDAKEMLYSDFYPDPDDDDMQSKAEKSVRFKGMESDEGEDEDAAEDDQYEGSNDEDDDDDEEGEEEQAEEEEVENEGLDAAARKALSELLGDSDEGEDALDILGGKSDETKKSAFEERQGRLKEKIEQLEEANLASKPWQLSGEVTSGKRPANSLLEEDLDFDATAKPGVEITEETTKSLEDIIRQRILDCAWDDVERKVKPKEDPYEFKKRVTLDQEKSKLSLAEIYEQEYIKQTQGEREEEEDPAHVEIKTMMDSLFLKLDALSNFHYTPKPAIPEVKIVTNVPSVSMEEVAPVTATDASLLAPEEVQEKKQGEFKGDTEKTETDKKYARRKKKTQQRVRAKEKEKRQKLVEKLNPGLGNKYSKQAAMEKLKKSSKVASSRTTIIEEGKGSKKSLTSSKSFFNQLQEEVTKEVHGVKAGKKTKHSKQVSSSKLKL